MLEHQPETCAAYPTNGVATFSNISVAVDHKLVDAPQWRALDERPACNSKATVIDPATIQITWDASSGSLPRQAGAGRGRAGPVKWAAANATAEDTAVGSQ